MTYIEWSDELGTGIPELDDEHKYFIAKIDELHSSIAAGGPPAEQIQLLDDVLDFLVGHTAREEALFAPTEYPDTVHHMRLHAHFIKHLAGLLCDLRQEATPKAIRSVLLMLKKWTLDHIQNVDLQYVPYLSMEGPEERGKTLPR